MSAFEKYIPSPLRDPNAWLNRPSGEAHATHAREADGKQARSNPFITNYADFVSGLVSALKGGGNVFRKLEAPLYPYHDAHAYDLNCLGADMYAAILSHSMKETANVRPTRSGDTPRQGTRERKNGHDAAEHTSSGP